MRRYVVGRLLLMIPTLIGVAILTFVIMRAVPGDIVALKYAGSPVPQSVIDEERQLDLNVRAVMRLSHAAVRSMTSRRKCRSIFSATSKLAITPSFMGRTARMPSGVRPSIRFASRPIPTMFPVA